MFSGCSQFTKKCYIFFQICLEFIFYLLAQYIKFIGNWNRFIVVRSKYSDLYGIPYDYRSVMHFGQYAFSNNSKQTIITKDPTVQNIIGKATSASDGDYKKICGIYKCSKCLGLQFHPSVTQQVGITIEAPSTISTAIAATTLMVREVQL